MFQPLDRFPHPLELAIRWETQPVPVTIADWNLSLLTSPPAPEPTPDPKLFTHKLLAKSREAWISAPQPDRLTLVIPLSHYVFGKALPPKVSVPDFLALFAEHVTNPPSQADVVGKSKYAYGKDWRATVLAFGKRDTRVHFSYQKHKALGVSLRVDMNPRKLGPKGIGDLMSFLGVLFDLKGIAGAARITRLDVAVDVVGVHVSEIVARYKKQGKRSLYVGGDGELETIYLHRKKTPFKQKEDQFGPLKAVHSTNPAGEAVVHIYDRVRERAAIGQPPPFGDAPVTRIEVVKRRFKKTNLFALPFLKDPLADLRVGFAPSQTSQAPALWRRFIGLTRTSPLSTAAEALGLPHGIRQQLEAALAVTCPDLVAPDLTWLGWESGLKNTGLDQLIESEKTV